ncbi:MAG: ATP-grasp domain-containing protein [Paramuribaculum sp.]|nr:ATP-grasp domain-containing protein [Paramuribaculum sp.]
MENILIVALGGAKRVNMLGHFISTGRQLGFNVSIVSYELEKKVPVAAIADVVIGKRWSDPDLLDNIIEVIDRYRSSKKYASVIVLPFVDGAIAPAARLASRCSDIYSPVSPEEVAKNFFDKRVSASLFEAAQLPVPETIDPLRPVFPLIAKPRKGSASAGITIARSADELEVLLSSADNYLFQKYIEAGEEFTTDCFIARDGEILTISPRRRLATLGGEVVDTITVSDDVISNLSRKAISAFALRGAVSIQFIRDREGNTYFMEINPRLGGGATCSVSAGADIPAMIIKESLGMTPDAAQATPGVEAVRYFEEYIFNNRQ